MKILLFLFTLISFSVVAEIKNGYRAEFPHIEGEIIATEAALETAEGKYKKILTDKLTHLQQIQFHLNYTDEILSLFKQVDPDLYDWVDGIRDEKGRTVDVYVKIIYSPSSGVNGKTNLSRWEKDNYYSEYGVNTVSVTVKMNQKIMYTLAHEFGHVLYQVPNLSSYMEYYLKNYKDHEREYGHKKGDPSGEMAELIEQQFANKYKMTSFTSPVRMYYKTRKL